MPFQNLSTDPEQEYFADGLVEEIITALSRVRSIFVIARNSSFAYKGKSPNVRQVGRELGVRYGAPGGWRGPAGESPARVRGSARPVASVASWKVTTAAKRRRNLVGCGIEPRNER